MKINSKEYFKVRDPQVGETGWAFTNDQDQVILDNNFDQFPAGTILFLADDGFTIDDALTHAKLDAQAAVTKAEEQLTRTQRQLAETQLASQVIGQTVHSKTYGDGLITRLAIDGRLVVQYQNEIKKYLASELARLGWI